MKYIYTKQILVILVLLWHIPINAQNVIWSEDFGGGQIPTNWTNTDASGQLSTVWTWKVTGLYFPGQPNFSSPTASNGFAMFNSYSAGPLPANHDVRLTTNAIDCSTLSTVIAKFSSQYSYYSSNNGSIVRLGVSTDGTTFTYFPILTDVSVNDLTISSQIEEIDISTVAAGQSTVYLQFRWIGNYEYTWRIDDIKLQDMFTPSPVNNLAISFPLLPSTYQIPQSQLDTLFFKAQIDNIGINTQTNVQLNAKIKTTNNQIIFNKSISIDSIPPNSSEHLIFTDYLPPHLNTGNYSLSYSVTQDSIDDDLSDNYFESEFIISDTTFSVDNNNFHGQFSGGSGTFNAGSYAVANYYYIPNDSAIATSVTFAANNPIDLNNETIDFILYQVDLDKDGDLDDNNDNVFNSSDLLNNAIAYAQYTFTGLEASNQLLTVNWENLNNTGDKIILEKNGSYLVYLGYSGFELFLITAGEAIPYSNLSTIGVNTTTDTWLLGGLPNGLLAVLRLNIGELGTATKNSLPQHSINIFPNPVKDYLNVSFDLEQYNKEIKLTLTDVQGRELLTDNLKNIHQKNIQYNVQNIPTGIYFLTIITENGLLTKEVLIRN